MLTAAPETQGNGSPQARRVAEKNAKFFERMVGRWENLAAKRLKEVATAARLDYDPIKIVKDDNFSLYEAKRQFIEKFKLTEELTQTQLYALTTGLITVNLSQEYQLVTTCYRDLARITPSKRSEESYFPIQRGDVPTPVGDNEEANETSLGGNLSRIKNYRWAEILKYSRTLEDDDQTGSISEAASNLGEIMAYAEELWWLQILIKTYVAGNVRTAGGIVPNECVAGQQSSTYGGPTLTAGPPTQSTIANLWTAADFVTGVNGMFALVTVDAGIFSNSDKFTVKAILASDFNPATPSASAGVVPGTFAVNVLKDEFKAYYTPFMKYLSTSALGSGNPWGLGKAGKMGVFQERTALEVTMEDPNAGISWSANQRRYKCERRFGAGVPMPEFFLRGN